MIFNFVWRSVLTMLRSLPVLLMLLAGAAQATTFNFNGGNVVPTCPLTGTTYTCTNLPNSIDTDIVIIASGYTVIVNAPVSFTYNQQFSMSGTASLQSSNGSINLATINPSSLNISGGTLVAKTSLAVGVKAITADLTAASLSGVSNTKITGSINVSGAVQLQSATTIIGTLSGGTIDTGSGSSFTGNITATTSFTLASAGKVVGNVTAPVVNILASPSTVTGDIKASTSLKLESGATVNGNVSGGSLQMDPSPVVINGNATMTGDVDIGSGDTINGDLKARNVMTRSSNAYISGNAIVNAITLNYAAKVGKTIYCTAPGSVNCSCVTNNSGYGMPAPTCAAGQPPAAGGPDHIQINHSGTALTCQPQNVTITACANAACTAPHYSTSTTVTLAPGGQSFTISGSGAGTVQQFTPGDVTLSASAPGVAKASTCVNDMDSSIGNQCNMNFQDKGLVVTVPDHLSMAAVKVTVQALQAQGNNQSCVPLLKSLTAAPIDFKCDYKDPVPGKAANVPLQIMNAAGSYVGVACDGTSSTINLAFDISGTASANFQYPEVGKLALTASYGTGSAFNATGANSFTAAPARIDIVPLRVANTPTLPAGVFAHASAPFTVKLSAVNMLGNVTTNFGKEQTAENFKPAVAISTDNPNGVVKAGDFAAISNGVSNSVSGANGYWNYSDVGNITISASLANYTSNYLSNPAGGFNTQGTKTLRFIPDHFDVLLPNKAAPSATRAFDELPSNQIAGVPMPCGLAGGISNPCGTANGSGNFIYSKQPFYVVVKAYNGATPPALTQNYITDTVHTASSLAKPITLSAWTTPGGATASTAGAMVHAAPAAFTFTKGVGILAYVPIGTAQMQNIDATLPNFTFTSATSLPANIYVRAVDTDTATSARSNGASTELALTVVSGRMIIANNYGAVSSGMPVSVQAQYYSAAGAWVFNAAYASDAQGIGNGNISYANCKSGGAAVTCPALTMKGANSLTFIGGKAGFLLSSPVAGSVDVTLYPDHWYNNYLPAPYPGRATFGIYRSGPVIYTREVHN